MRKSRAIYLTVLLAVLAPAVATLPGCAGKGALEPMQIATIVRGRTTKPEVVNSLGDPDKITDLGFGKEEWQYIREAVASHGNWFHADYRAFWIVFKNNVVEAYGEHATADAP